MNSKEMVKIAYDALDDINAVGNGINGDDGQLRHLDEKQRQRNGKHPDIDTVIQKRE